MEARSELQRLELAEVLVEEYAELWRLHSTAPRPFETTLADRLTGFRAAVLADLRKNYWLFVKASEPWEIERLPIAAAIRAGTHSREEIETAAYGPPAMDRP